jgi:hypothetical protein
VYHAQDIRSMVVVFAAAMMLGVSAPAVPATGYATTSMHGDALGWYLAALPAAIRASAPTVGVPDALPGPQR